MVLHKISKLSEYAADSGANRRFADALAAVARA